MIINHTESLRHKKETTHTDQKTARNTRIIQNSSGTVHFIVRVIYVRTQTRKKCLTALLINIEYFKCALGKKIQIPKWLQTKNKKIKINILLFFILAMASNLTVIKHNHYKRKYPTHDSGITWQPRVHSPVTPQGRLQKILCVYSIQPSGNLSDNLRTGGGESGRGLRLGSWSK